MVKFAALGAVVSVGAVSMAGRFSRWSVRLRRLGAARIGSFALLPPLFGVLGTVFLLGEAVGWPLFAGGAFILAGLPLVVASPGARRD
jgi:drug/metabolite transporter (DMT)-like permease